MNLHDLAGQALSLWLDQDRRPVRLRFARSLAQHLDDVLLPQRLHVSEGLCEGLTLRLTCLTPRADLDVSALVGVPLEAQLVTDRGGLRRFCAVVTQARLGQGDGGLTAVQITARDVLAVMAQRRSARVFLDQSAIEIARTVLSGWRLRFPALARCFDWQLLAIDAGRYPKRACTLQLHQSDAAFLRALLAREGVGWFIRPGDDGEDETPRQQLVLFDDLRHLPANAAGPVRFHHSRGTEQRDSIELLAPTHTLAAGGVRWASWDHERARADVSLQEHGGTGSALSAALRDARIVPPHAGDDLNDLDRLARVALRRHAGSAQCLHGVGAVRDQAVGEYNRIEGHAALDAAARQDPRRGEFVTIGLEHWARGNLPKELDARAQALLDACGEQDVAAAAPPLDADERYANRFTAVARDAPWAPPWDPSLELPALPLMTATVVGVQGVPVWCDDLGRVKVQFHGLDAEDHAHASGAGTNGNAGDSAWVRVNGLWCGAGFGVVFPLRPGMEVSIGFEMGDPSRPVIIGSRHHVLNVPPRFDGLAGLPHNHALSGIVTRELGGNRGQQLRFNDSPRGFSAQLASDHGASQLNLGDLATPMRKGQTQPRGEGFELRSDAGGAIRTAKALLLSAWAQLDASGNQLDTREHLALMQECLELFKSLGRYAAQHRGLAADEAGQDKLLADVKGASAGSNVDPHGQGGAPTLNLTAPAGIAATTPKTILSYAGVSIDSVAQQHLQWTAGQRISAHAGQGIHWFAQHGGISAIAHRGTWLMQSQHGDVQVDAGQDLNVSARRRMVFTAGEELLFVLADGTALRLSKAGIELLSQQPLTGRTAGARWEGPGTVSATLPTFDSGSTSQRFVLRVGGPEGPVAADQPYEITLSDGTTHRGRSDANGLTELLQHEAMHIADIRIPSDGAA